MPTDHGISHFVGMILFLILSQVRSWEVKA